MTTVRDFIAALDLIDAMADRVNYDPAAIRDALEDGEALASMGYDDQAAIEAAHAICVAFCK